VAADPDHRKGGRDGRTSARLDAVSGLWGKEAHAGRDERRNELLVPGLLADWHLERGWMSVVGPETCPERQFGRVMCLGHQAVAARHPDPPSTFTGDKTCESGPDNDLGWEDIESELCSSNREAGVQCSPPLS
jgi:hypothetical protein